MIRSLRWKGAAFTVPFQLGFVFLYLLPIGYAVHQSLFVEQQSGLGLGGATENATYAYLPAAPEIQGRVRQIDAICRRHDTPLAAAALQFPLAHPSVASIIPGAAAPDHLRQTVEHLRRPIPRDLWEELKSERFLHAAAPTPNYPTPN